MGKFKVCNRHEVSAECGGVMYKLKCPYCEPKNRKGFKVKGSK